MDSLHLLSKYDGIYTFKISFWSPKFFGMERNVWLDKLIFTCLTLTFVTQYMMHNPLQYALFHMTSNSEIYAIIYH